MKIEWNKQYNTIAIYVFLVLSAIGVVVLALFNYPTIVYWMISIVKILMPFIYGFCLAYLINPVVRTIEDKVLKRIPKNKMKPKLMRITAMVLAYLFATIIIAIFIAIVLPQIAVSISNLAIKIPDYAKEIETWVRTLIQQNQGVLENNLFKSAVEKLNSTLDSILKNAAAYIQGALSMILKSTSRFTTGLLNVILGIIISFYMISSKERFFAQIKKTMYGLFSNEKVDLTLQIAHKSNKIFSGFIIGKLIDSLIIGIICFICTTIMQIPYALLISVIVGVTNIIPYFGPFIGAIPSVLILLIEDYKKAILFLVFILILQQIDGNIIGPKILGDSTGLSAIWVVFSILIFGGTMGFIGMFIGVPVFAVIYDLTRSFVEARLVKKNMPSQTQLYASKEHPIDY